MYGGGDSRGIPGLDLPELDAAARAVFRLALREGGLRPGPDTGRAAGLDDPAFDRARAALLALRLLRAAPDHPEVLLPVSPEVAAAELAAPLKSVIADADARLRSVGAELGTLIPEYLASRRAVRQRDPVQVLADPATAAAVLAQEADQCREEVFTIRSGPEQGADTPGGLARDLALLERGVRMRTLFRLASRPSAALRAQARQLLAAGAQYRGAPELPAGATVLDRSVAFLPRLGPGGRPTGTLLVRDPDMVGYLCLVFDHLWSAGTPFDATAEPRAEQPRTASPREQATGEVRRAVVRMLAEGAKDEMIARRLGISLRTCRRHIAEVLETLRADSRFQGGVLAERSGLTTPWAAGIAAEEAG